VISGADSQGIPSYLGTTRNIGLLLAAKSGTDRRLADQAIYKLLSMNYLGVNYGKCGGILRHNSP
jgi:hypothetical protein